MEAEIEGMDYKVFQWKNVVAVRGPNRLESESSDIKYLPGRLLLAAAGGRIVIYS